MKTLLLAIACFIMSLTVMGQTLPPSIKWQQFVHLSPNDQVTVTALRPTADGGYVVAGSSQKTPGENQYYLVAKLSAAGAVEWQYSYLWASGLSEARAITQAADGGYIVAGYVENGPKGGNYDVWVLKLNALGIKQWEKFYGGSKNDNIYSVIPANDGGFIMAGATNSGNTGAGTLKGKVSAWVVKIDTAGTIAWQKLYGGSVNEGFNKIKAVSGGYILCGYSFSNNIDVTGHYGGTNNADAWVVKIDNTGTLGWQKNLGGTSFDVANDIIPTSDGNYVVASESQSSDNQVTGSHGLSDSWVAKINNTGGLLWQKALGGSNADNAATLVETPGGNYLVANWTTSVDGDVTGNHGGGEYWLVLLNASGAMQWQSTLGGSKDEGVHIAPNIINTGDSDFVVAGYTTSTDGDVVGGVPAGYPAQGIGFGWVVRLTNEVIQTHQTINFPAIPYTPLNTADFNPGATASSGLQVTYASSDTNVASIVAGKIHLKSIGTTNITASQSGNAQYSAATPVTQTLTVTRKSQFITFNTFDGITYTTPDFVPPAHANTGLPLTFTVQDTSIASIVAGKLHIKKTGSTYVWAYQAGNAEYLPDTSAQYLQVNKAIQILHVESIFPKSACDPDWTPTFYASSGLPLVITVSDTNVLTIVNGKLHFKAAGSVTLTLNQPGNENFSPMRQGAVGVEVTGKVTPQITIAKTVGAKAYNFSMATGVAKANINTGYTTLYSPGNQPEQAPLVSLPFPFFFGGYYYTEFSANEHGIIRFGGLPLGRNDYPGASGISQQPSIYAWFSHMGIGSNGNVRYKIIGATGSRKIVVQWNVRDSTPGNFDRTIQAWLYEGSFKIQFVYSHAGEIEGKGKIGVSNPSNDFLVLNPALNQATNTVNRSSNDFPASGTSYIFTVPGIQQVCPGDVAVYHAQVFNQGFGPHYQWVKNGSNVGIDNSIYSDNTPHTGDSIWCILTTTVCSNTPVVTSNKVYEVIERLVPAVAVTGKPNLCTGDTASFRATVNNAGATPHYQWMKNGTAVGTDADLYTSTALVAGDSVWVVVTVAAADTACSSTPVITSNKITVKVNTYTTPVLTVTTAPAGSICAGTPVTFKAQTNAGNVHSYQWVKNGIAVGTDSSRYNTATLTGNDTVWAVGTDITGCVLANTAVSNKVVKMVSSAPPAAAGAISGPATVSSGQTGIVYSVTNVAGVSYLWQAPAAVIVSGQGTSSITVNWGSTAGNVNVTAQNACGSAEKVTLHIEVAGSLTGTLSSTGSNESIQVVRNDVRVMPNPSSSMAYVVFNAAGTYKYSLQLTDGTGKVVFTRDGYAVKGENRVAIDVTHMANALYFVRLNDKQYGTRSAKLVVGK